MSGISNNNALLGVYGGSFDPVHLGHIAPATEAAKLIGLNHLTLIPCHLSPLKDKSHSSAINRVEMLELALKDYPEIHLDLREINREETSYTIETLKEIKQENPLKTICFFIGMDSLSSFTKWVKWQEILELVHLIVMNRGEIELSQLALNDTIKSRITKDLTLLKEASAGSILIMDTVKLPISSSEIRQKIKRKEDISALIPSQVANYIRQHDLYLN